MDLKEACNDRDGARGQLFRFVKVISSIGAYVAYVAHEAEAEDEDEQEEEWENDKDL